METVLMSSIDLKSMIIEAVGEVLSLIQPTHYRYDEKPISQNELSKFLDVTVETLIKWRAKGKIPYIQIGSNIRYVKSKVIEALEVDKKKGRAA